MKRVIVTGANGFIGRHATGQLLREGWEVHALGRSLPAGEAPRQRLLHHRLDLMDAQALRACIGSIGAGALLHLAWDTDPATYRSSLANFDWVGASLALLDAFRRAGGVQAVCAGSCAEYDWRHGYCREDLTPLRPDSVYGRCKRALSDLSLAYAEASGLSLTWGRVFFLYGPHEPAARLVPAVVRALLGGEPVAVSSGEQLRDYLHVADVAAAFVRLLDAAPGGCVNIASGEPVAVRRIVETLAGLLDGHGRLHFGAVPRPAGDPALIAGDNARLRACGWQPRYTLDAGLADAIDWWRTRSAAGEEAR